MDILLIVEIIISVLLIGLILTQNKEGGLSAGMGGADGSFQSTKRGPEKIIFNMTVFLAIAYVVVALLMVVL